MRTSNATPAAAIVPPSAGSSTSSGSGGSAIRVRKGRWMPATIDPEPLSSSVEYSPPVASTALRNSSTAPPSGVSGEAMP